MMSCSLEELTNNWTSITIFNQTNYEISNIVPNAQYHIQIYISNNDTNTTQRETDAFALTPATSIIFMNIFINLTLTVRIPIRSRH